MIFRRKSHLKELSAAELHEALQHDRIVLVDVREPSEYAAERIHGALLFPLSSFDPKALPIDPSRPVVLQCGSGKRSATAAARCGAAGVPVDMHLKGGIAAWKAAGLRTVSIDANTGAVIDRK